jgi:low affinity Fe/Cu permease
LQPIGIAPPQPLFRSPQQKCRFGRSDRGMTNGNGNGHGNGHGKSRLEQLGCDISSWVSDIAANPFAQVGFLLFCIAWFVVGWNVNILTAGLSILAITLTQMVLNRQNEREIDDRRRDVAMHAKLDELIAATKRARNEFVDLEDRAEDEIVQLKEDVKETIEESPRNGVDPETATRPQASSKKAPARA